MHRDLTPYLRERDLLELIGTDTRLKRVAATSGGEYAGPCPFCGGRDRLRVQPNAEPHPRWMCRQCTGADRWDDAIGYVMRRQRVDFKTACQILRLDLGGLPPRGPRLPPLPPVLNVPANAWQDRGRSFVEECRAALWEPDYTPALQYVQRRGLMEDTLQMANIGYNPRDRYEPREWWGLDPADGNGTATSIWLPRGIVFPWSADRQLWKISIRRPLSDAELARGEAKYVTVSGSANALYGVDYLDANKPAVIVEGAIDALVLMQVSIWAGMLPGAPEPLPIVPVACGTTGGARLFRWSSRLACCSHVLVALDNDDDPAKGEQAAEYWCKILQDNGVRWRPVLKDPGAMAEAGMDVRQWLENGLAHAQREAARRLEGR